MINIVLGIQFQSFFTHKQKCYHAKIENYLKSITYFILCYFILFLLFFFYWFWVCKLWPLAIMGGESRVCMVWICHYMDWSLILQELVTPAALGRLLSSNIHVSFLCVQFWFDSIFFSFAILMFVFLFLIAFITSLFCDKFVGRSGLICFEDVEKDKSRYCPLENSGLYGRNYSDSKINLQIIRIFRDR